MIGNWIMPRRGAVVAPEPISPIVSRASLLCKPGGGFENAGLRMHAKVSSSYIHFRSCRRLTICSATLSFGVWTLDHSPGLSPNDSAQKSVGSVNPVVQAERKAIDARLIIPRRKACEQLLDAVGRTVSLRGFGVKDIRGGANKRAFAPCGHTGRKWQVIKE